MGLYGYRWRASIPQGIVLLQRGFAEHESRYAEHYGGLVTALVGCGLDVYAFDLEGHGLSPGERGLTDVRRMVEAHLLARRLLADGKRPLFLIGHSLGALVTAGSVARDVRGLAGVVLSGSALPRANAAARVAANLLAVFAPRRSATRFGSPEPIFRFPKDVVGQVSKPLTLERAIPMWLGASAIKIATNVDRHASDWCVPTLFVHSSADIYTNPSGTERLFARIATQDKRYVVFAGDREEHLKNLCRDEILATMRTWLAEQISAA